MSFEQEFIERMLDRQVTKAEYEAVQRAHSLLVRSVNILQTTLLRHKVK